MFFIQVLLIRNGFYTAHFVTKHFMNYRDEYESIKNTIETQKFVKLKVTPNAKETKSVKTTADTLFLSVKEPPEDGKANTAIIKYFKKLLGRDVELIGKKGRNKLLKIK